MTYTWVIELVGTGSVHSCYFDGHTEPGWHGVVTHEANRAQQYPTRLDAERDIEKLRPWPAGLGEWVAAKHGWD